MLYDPKTGKRNGFSTLSSHQFSHTEKLAWHQFQAAMVNRTVILTGLLQKRTEGPTWSLEQHPRHRPKNHQNVGLVWFHPLNMATPLHISWFEFQSHHINDPRCMGNSTMRCYKPYIYIWNKPTLLHPPHSRCFFLPGPFPSWHFSLQRGGSCNENVFQVRLTFPTGYSLARLWLLFLKEAKELRETESLECLFQVAHTFKQEPMSKAS